MTENRQQITDIYVQDFNSFKVANLHKNPDFVVTEAAINQYIEGIVEKYKSYFDEEILLSTSEKEEVIKKIKSLHSVFQGEGDVILGDYNHDYSWYKDWLNSDKGNTYYWDRYKNYLLGTKHFAPEIVNVLENDTLMKLMSYLGDPHSENPFSIRGLVVGDVQSGKTSNYLGLVAKAADAGYRVIFILTGTIESLRKQTQERVEEGFIGYDSVHACDVGVGRGDPIPKSFTSRDKDFLGSDNQNTTYKLSNYSSEPMVFVLKKNASVLQKVYTSLKNLNTTQYRDKIDYPALVIDDEADNASINTNKLEEDPTKINGLIRQLVSLFTKSSYVGFTATPFANVFISYDKEDEMLNDDLFPRDFIYSLKAPSNYHGPRSYFLESNNNIRYIADADEFLFPIKHKKEWDGTRLFESLYDAVRAFLLANAIRDLRDSDINTHRSMLINMSRFKNVQSKIKDIVENYFSKVKRTVKQTHKLPYSLAQKNPIVQALEKTFNEQYGTLADDGNRFTYNKVFAHLYQSISDIKVVVVNSGKNASKLNYQDHKEGLRVIAVGGLALSRGLTLEGLITSYFYRNTSTFDVLMQMGRWFGYRDGYSDLCRIWLTEKSKDYYQYILESIEDLKSDIKTMGQEQRKPEDFGIRVRNDSLDLGITAANKMRGTTTKIVRKSFYGGLFETPYIQRNLDLVEENIDNTIRFLEQIGLEKRDPGVGPHPYFRNIPFSSVYDLVEDLNISPTGDAYFDQGQIVKFMEGNKNELPMFDVLVMGGDSKIGGKENPYRFQLSKLNIDIPLVGRQFDVRGDDIRMSKGRLRLGGKDDTKHGLRDDKIPLTHTKNTDYLIKGRNPLLIVYFVKPNIKLPDEISEEILTSDKNIADDYLDMVALEKELSLRRYQFIVGYGLGFPKKDNVDFKTIMYTVNKTVNYFEMEHSESIEE